jgi:hypothetical protein
LIKESEKQKENKNEKLILLLASCAPSWLPLLLVNTHTQLIKKKKTKQTKKLP